MINSILEDIKFTEGYESVNKISFLDIFRRDKMHYSTLYTKNRRKSSSVRPKKKWLFSQHYQKITIPAKNRPRNQNVNRPNLREKRQRKHCKDYKTFGIKVNHKSTETLQFYTD